MKRLIVAALTIIACGQQPLPPATGVLAPGKYELRIEVTSTQGECGWVPEKFTRTIEVDDQGQVQSPFPETSCTTTYGQDTEGVTIECTGAGQKVVMNAGQGQFDGDIGGCKQVVFTYSMWEVM